MLKKMMLENDLDRIRSRSHKAILVSGTLNAAFSVLILIIAARTVSLEYTGFLTIAFAISKLMLIIGKFGMRNYQVTDNHNVYFSEWLSSRIVTTGVMLIVSLLYVIFQSLFGGYSFEKSLTVILLCTLYSVECIEDIYTGHYQKCGRLDISSIIQSIRVVMMMVGYSIGLVVFHNVFWGSVLAILLSLICVYAFAIKPIKYFDIEHQKPRVIVIARILKDCFPLFLMGFVLIYISNASKYVIDKQFDPTVQAYFGFVSMPIFAISLFSGFIFQPQLAGISNDWNNRNYREFRGKVKRQMIYITAMALSCIFIGWFLGMPVLSILYGVKNLSDYKAVFMWLLVGGAAEAIVNYMSALFTIFRKQRLLLILHTCVALGMFITINPITKTWGIIGSAIGTSLWVWLLAFALLATYARQIRINTSK